MSRPRLNVVQDRNALKEQVRQGSFGRAPSCVMTASQFFDQIRLQAFVADPRLVQSDLAIQAIAAELLVAEDPQHLSLAPHYARLLNYLFQGRATPEEVLRRLQSADLVDGADRLRVLARLVALNKTLAERKLVGGGASLALAYEGIERTQELPVFLSNFSSVQAWNLVDLTELELATLTLIAKLGMSVEMTLPYDAQARGVTLPVSYLAERIEKNHDIDNFELHFDPIEGEGPLAPFVRSLWDASPCDESLQEQIHVGVFSDVVREARWVAGVIAALKNQHAQAPSIALAMRTLDSRATHFRDALRLQGIAVRERKGQALPDSALMQLLLLFLEGRAQHWPRDLLLSILSHPGMLGRASQAGNVGEMQRHLQAAAARSDREDSKRPKGAYRYRLERLLRSAKNDAAASKSIELCLAQVTSVLQIGETIPLFATLREYLRLLSSLLEQHVSRDFEEWQKLFDLLSSTARQLGDTRTPISLQSFTKWWVSLGSSETLTPPKCDDADAVEILPLKELFGRQFDYVIIADMVHGRMPKAPKPDPLLKDNDRFEINRLMKAPVLRLYEDNPLEESVVPPRQALEPLWFLGGCASATHGLIFSASKRDESGRDQAKSEFLDAALMALGLDPEGFEGVRSSLQPLPNALERRIHDAPQQSDKLGLLREIQLQRQRFFSRAPEQTPEQVAGAYAFAVDPSLFRKRFERRLGLLPGSPLTPTPLEGIAYCRYRGFVEKLLKVDANPEPSHDMDARTLGRLAHEVLEAYYQSGPQTRASLSSILRRLSTPYLEASASGHDRVLAVYVDWLETALQRLVANLERDPPVIGVQPKSFELAIGTGREQPSRLGSVPIRVGEETLYFGGIIDRVDEGAHARVVVDYKTSKGSAIQDKLSASSFLVSHFQLPLYLRLLEHHAPSSEDTALLGYLVSIREGSVSDIVGQKRYPDLRRRILDDSAPDGLAQSLHQVLSPLLAGVVPPDVGERCRRCEFKRVCRIETFETMESEEAET